MRNAECLHLMPQEFRKENSSPDVLLINVPSTFSNEVKPSDDEPSFGLLRIATVLEKNGFEGAILDTQRGGLSLSEIESVVHGIKPKLVGLNPTSVNVSVAQEIAEVCNQEGIPVVLGGIHATLSPYEALKRDFPLAYAAVRGKGEISIAKILEDLTANHKRELKGVYYQETAEGRTDFADVYPLDSIPIIQQLKYVHKPINERKICVNGETYKLRESALYVTSGCPFNCTFCATPALVGEKGAKPYLRPEISNILASVKYSIDILGANAIHFVDDLVFITSEHYLSFIQGLNDMHLSEPFYWRAMARASQIDKLSDNDLTKIADSGCWRITMGVEAGNEDILRRIRKKITKDEVRRSVVRLRNAGIPAIKAFFIMGYPDETLEQMHDTRDFILELKKLGLTDISLFQFIPWPGTEEWSRLNRSKSEVLNQLSYLRRKGSEATTQMAQTKVTEMFWLPPDLRISEVPSGKVEELVRSTIQMFYN